MITLHLLTDLFIDVIIIIDCKNVLYKYAVFSALLFLEMIKMNKKKDITYKIDETMEDVTNKKCPIIYALSIIGQKWKLPILWYLHEKENTRYNELKRRIPGITNIMLTKSLRELEEAGLVSRKVYETIPPKVEYALTESGQELLPTLNRLPRKLI